MTTERTTEATGDGDDTQRVVLHRRAGKWPEELAVGSFTLDYDDRYRHPFLFRRPILLPEGTTVQGVPPDAAIGLMSR